MTRRPPTDLNIVARYYARWSPNEDKRREIANDHKEMFADAKADGLNPKALRKAFAEQYRVENQTADQAEKRSADDGDVELYLSALARVRESDDADVTPEAVEQVRRMAAPQLRAMGIDPDTGEVSEAGNPIPVSHTPVEPGGDDPETKDGAASSGETAQNIEPEAAMLPQTWQRHSASFHAAERVAVESSATVSKQEPSVETDRDGGAVELGGEEGSQSPLPSDRVENTSDGPTVIAAAPHFTDRTKPNPWCVDPDDCGVEASWNHMCGACLRRRDAQRANWEAMH